MAVASENSIPRDLVERDDVPYEDQPGILLTSQIANNCGTVVLPPDTRIEFGDVSR